MAKIHALRARMRSIAKIGQITKAMEQVAASKRRRAQAAVLRTRPYAYAARELLAQLAVLTAPTAHPLFARRSVKRRLYVVISGDRGLAGAYNSNVGRAVVHAVDEAREEAPPRVLVIGRKGAKLAAALERAGKIEVLGAYVDWPVQPSMAVCQPVADEAMRQYREGYVDVVSIIATDFTAGLRQPVTVRPWLPVQVETGMPAEAIGETWREAIFEPSPAAVLSYIVPRLVSVQLYQAVLEALAAEQSMRMAAMQNASENATELLGDLRLTYNSARQTAITQELAEISAGAEAMREVTFGV
ncbi:MAG: ATP synthase F1 subunit gamma [Candidatus Andersenbacteria bacterium]|nr:ATP synthase F1 subunit gamma [Candidatus Andersenbacteria bacterium]